MRAGDYEEHAILLCNYFMYADKEFGNDFIECFLVYGFTIPEGNNVYVGRKHKVEHTLELWDPINGDCYYFAKEWNTTPFLCFNFKTGLKVESGCNFFARFKILAMDQLCPMKEVSACITEENIFVNMQLGIGPALMFWDFSLKKHWKPFLLL